VVALHLSQRLLQRGILFLWEAGIRTDVRLCAEFRAYRYHNEGLEGGREQVCLYTCKKSGFSSFCQAEEASRAVSLSVSPILWRHAWIGELPDMLSLKYDTTKNIPIYM